MQEETQKPLRLRFVACKVVQREAYLCAARSHNIVDVHLMAQGLHDEPNKLREEVRKALETTTDIQGRPYDAILLGYGLCSNGIIGLSAKIPLVVPRGHDCITLLLGSKERYQQYFDTHRGIYWYSAGWVESGWQPSKERFDQLAEEYTEKYGADNAEYLLETENGWLEEYSFATYIDSGLACDGEHKEFTKTAAEYLKWNYDELKGDMSLVQRMCDGVWDDKEFLVLKPGEIVAEDLTNPGIIKAE
ncbi:MAG: DUF1638 domain-containing protein [Planctomycetes bacterium]|nr:DUF1638 domain-containing protein [Planctomycetota bacterium]